MDLLFAREVSYYIITIYLPTLMIVIVSWFSFWIDHKSVSCQYSAGESVSIFLSLSGPCPGKSLRDNIPGHVHHDGLHSGLPASRGLHQGGGRLDGDVCLLRLLLSDGVRLC